MIRPLLTATAVILLVAAPALAQKDAYKTPRLSDGRPDLQGDWSNYTLTPFQRDPALGARRVYTHAEVDALEGRSLGAGFGSYAGRSPQRLLVMPVRGELRTSIITSTPDGRVPPRKATFPPMAVQPAELPYANPESRPRAERCLSHAFAGGPVMRPQYEDDYIKIVQSRDSVAIVIEAMHDARIVRLGSKHRTDGLRPWQGDSIGWYKGDTLVVETTNYPREQALFGAWENLKVTERFTRLGSDRLLYEFQVEDPTVWDNPWGGEYEFHTGFDGFREYACHEGNYALASMLYAARQEEEAVSRKGVALESGW